MRFISKIEKRNLFVSASKFYSSLANSMSSTHKTRKIYFQVLNLCINEIIIIVFLKTIIFIVPSNLRKHCLEECFNP
jgi:uncharacterized membrane protein YsdA (DUF1294 family)